MMPMVARRTSLLVLAIAVGSPWAALAAGARAPTVVLVASSRVRGGGLHEHHAVALLLAKALRTTGTTARAVIMNEERAGAAGALSGAKTVVLLGEEGERHLLNEPRLRASVAQVLARGGGLVLIHGSAAPPPALEKTVRAWAGGLAHAESTRPSVNWPAGFSALPAHPILAGVAPFSVDDRWLPLRGGEGDRTLLALLRTDAPEYSRIAGSSQQTMAWTFERPEGGRTFVYGGGHFLASYQSEEVGRVLARAILWTAGLEIPVARSHASPPAEARATTDRPASL
jgi:hypothetical protein